jgi:hypothetical protein
MDKIREKCPSILRDKVCDDSSDRNNSSNNENVMGLSNINYNNINNIILRTINRAGSGRLVFQKPFKTLSYSISFDEFDNRGKMLRECDTNNNIRRSTSTMCLTNNTACANNIQKRKDMPRDN